MEYKYTCPRCKRGFHRRSNIRRHFYRKKKCNVVGNYKSVKDCLYEILGEVYNDTESTSTTMVTSGTMTNRIDQLCKVGLGARIENPEDGRSFIISLTQQGSVVIDAALSAHVTTQDKLTSSLSKKETNELNTLLRKYLNSLES